MKANNRDYRVPIWLPHYSNQTIRDSVTPSQLAIVDTYLASLDVDDFTHTRDEGVSARCCDAIRVEQKGLKMKGRELIYTRFARSGALFLIKNPKDAKH